MKRPVAFAVPIVIVMVLLIIPLGALALGGISEKYLPPDNSVRQAQEEFDKIFPGFRTEPLTLVIESNDGQPVTDAADRRGAQQGDGGVRVHRSRQRPVEDVAGTPATSTALPRIRRSASSRTACEIRNDAPKKIEELRAIHAATRTVRVGRRHTRAGAGQHPQPVRQAAADGGPADHHDDDPDVPGVRIGGVADQGRGDERADARLDDGHPDLDVRRRARLRPDELHAAAVDGADDRPDHRGDLGSVDRLRGVPGVPHGGGPRARHVHRRGHPDRHRDHRPADHRRRAGPGRGRGRVRVLRPGDDEVPGVRPAASRCCWTPPSSGCSWCPRS